MMNGDGIKKSDGVIVPQKVTNKGQPAELLEGELQLKGYGESKHKTALRRRSSVSQATDRRRLFVLRISVIT